MFVVAGVMIAAVGGAQVLALLLSRRRYDRGGVELLGEVGRLVVGVITHCVGMRYRRRTASLLGGSSTVEMVLAAVGGTVAGSRGSRTTTVLGARSRWDCTL